MPHSDNYSDGSRKGTLAVHSARGAVLRNAGKFSGGSWLITHEFFLPFSSAKLLAQAWFNHFCEILLVGPAIRLHQQKVQLIGFNF